MINLLLPTGQVLFGLCFLIWGANLFVTGTAATARSLGISPLIIGLVIVGLGTSAPEMIVSTIASLQNKPGLAIGNAIGSNIANMTLILGTTALILPITVRSQIVKRELPLLLLMTVLATILLLDNHLGRLDGLLLIIGMVTVLFWMIKTALAQRHDFIEESIDTEIPGNMPLWKSGLWLIIGLGILLFSSHILVQGAVSIAKFFGVTEVIIGLTIIAIGTSLPELAASLVAAIKHQHELVIGNVIGSNMFNLLVVLAIPGLIVPDELPIGVLNRDLPIMVLITFLIFIFAYSFGKDRGRINRIEGGLLLTGFFAFQGLLYSIITQ